MLRPEGFLSWVQILVKVLWENGVMRRSEVSTRRPSGSKASSRL